MNTYSIQITVQAANMAAALASLGDAHVPTGCYVINDSVAPVQQAATEPAVTKASRRKSEPAAEQSKTESEAPAEQPKTEAVSLSEVRAFLTPFLKDAAIAPRVSELISTFGVSKLSAVPENKLGELLAKAKEQFA